MTLMASRESSYIKHFIVIPLWVIPSQNKEGMQSVPGSKTEWYHMDYQTQAPLLMRQN